MGTQNQEERKSYGYHTYHFTARLKSQGFPKALPGLLEAAAGKNPDRINYSINRNGWKSPGNRRKLYVSDHPL